MRILNELWISRFLGVKLSLLGFVVAIAGCVATSHDVSDMQKPQVTVGGLGLGPNDLARPSGSFKVADNVVHRRKGILTPLEADVDTTIEPDVGHAVRLFADWAPRYWASIESPGQLRFSDQPTAYISAFDPARTQAVYTDGRHIFSGAHAFPPVVVDNLTDSTHGAPRMAGLPSVPYFAATARTTVGTTFPPWLSGAAAYKIVVRRKIGTRYVVSSPSYRDWVIGGGAHYGRLNVSWASVDSYATSPFAVGDEIVVYRTRNAATFDALDDVYYEAVTVVLDASDIAASTVQIEDVTPEAALGTELYTNPGQETSLKTNIVPPQCNDVTTFSGTTFYANRLSQPVATVNFKGASGLVSVVSPSTDAEKQTRQWGVGGRGFVGNTAGGSPNITGVTAAFRIGLTVGQLVESTSIVVPAETYITAISGSGPYTVTVSNLLPTGASANFTSYDTATFAFVKNGVTTTSKPVPFRESTSSGKTARRFALSLLTLEDTSSQPLSGVRTDFTGSEDADDPYSFQFSWPVAGTWDSFTVSMTNQDNWSPSRPDTFGTLGVLSSVQETRQNVVWYSKTNEPEHTAPVQFFTIGSGVVYRLVNVQSAMLAFASDGVFRITGAGDVWDVQPIDSTAHLVHPDAVSALDTKAFAWLESGFSVCTEVSCDNISQDAIGPELQDYMFRVGDDKFVWGPTVAVDHPNNDVWLQIGRLEGDEDDYTKTYIFNTFTGQFTAQTTHYTGLSYNQSNLKMLRATAEGYFDPAEADFKPATVVYNPVVEENAGIVKQWNDVNLLFDEVIAPTPVDVQVLYGGELTSSTNTRAVTSTTAFALHSLVPKRVSRQVELTVGFNTPVGFYFEFKGFTPRYRVASETVKR